MTATAPMRRLQVMVVDDEALARSRLRTLLGDCHNPGAEVVAEGAHAGQALEMLRGRRLDVVFLDIHMPGADGLALAQTLKTLPQPPVVVFVTAHAEHALQDAQHDAQQGQHGQVGGKEECDALEHGVLLPVSWDAAIPQPAGYMYAGTVKFKSP